MKRALQPGRVLSALAIAAIASMWPLSASARPTLRIDCVLGFGRRPGSHVEPVGDRAHRRAGERKIVPEAREGVLADEGEAGERRNLQTRARRRRPRPGARSRRRGCGGARERPRSRRSGRRREGGSRPPRCRSRAGAGAGRRRAPWRHFRPAKRRRWSRSRPPRTARRPADRRPGSSAHSGCKGRDRGRRARPTTPAAARNARCAAGRRRSSGHAPSSQFRMSRPATRRPGRPYMRGTGRTNGGRDCGPRRILLERSADQRKAREPMVPSADEPNAAHPYRRPG